MSEKTPILFVSHGSPMIAVEDDIYTQTLAGWGKKVSPPRALVVVSAHWEEAAPTRVNTAAQPPMIYDFGGFPDELYQVNYPAPGSPQLASEILTTLASQNIAAAPESHRGYDHGLWTPLHRLFPNADIPIVEISLMVPRRPADIFRLGEALAPLRSKGVMLIGTGGIVHNLARLRFGNKQAPVDAWADQFDQWVKERLEKNEIEQLLDYRRLAPHADLAVPTPEHFDPIFFPLAAARGEKVSFIYEGFHYGNLSMRSFSTIPK